MLASAQKIVNRSASPATPPVHIRHTPGTLQPALRVSSPSDPAEREAERTARQIVRMPEPPGAASALASSLAGTRASPHAARFAGAIRQPAINTPVARLIARDATPSSAPPTASRPVAERIGASQSSGQPLPEGVRQFMEPRFKADFSRVRIHTGEQAARLSSEVAAQAFTVGNHVYFGEGRYQPDSREGRELIAHELTHTIQQGAATQRGEDAQQTGARPLAAEQRPAARKQQSEVQRQADVTVNERSTHKVQRLGLGDALDFIAGRANNIPGFRMFTVVLGVNPINMSRVERSAANVMRAVVEFMPGGALITQALDNHGVFERVGNWVNQQIRTLGMTGSVIREAVNRFIASLGIRDMLSPGAVWERAKRIFTEPINRIISFVRGLVSGIIRFIRDAILLPLARLASGTRGWDLLCAVLGRNPITNDAVPRNAETLIGGFMRLIGQEEVWQNMQRANAVPRAFAWFNGALADLTGFVRQIPTLFVNTLRSLQIIDLVLVPRAFLKVASVFGSFALRFAGWAGNAVWNLLEIIFDSLKPGIMGYIRRTGAALKSILRNPLPFVRNLVNAAKSGFLNFARNFVQHLKTGLIEWLTGALTGVYIPKALSLAELGKFALSVLGITWRQIRGKIVRALGERGETIMRALETGLDIVVALVRGGPAAVWELLKEKLASLKEAVISGIVGFVSQTIIMKAIPKLVAMFIPGAGFISAIISIYDTIMVFVQRISRIIQVVTGFINSIVNIAAGNIAAAANRVESTLAGLLSLAISFLAGFVGLGRIGDAIMRVVGRVRATVDRALDAVIRWIVAQAKRLGNLAAGAARNAVAWWRARRSFRGRDGQTHALYFTGERRTARPTVASTPMPVDDFLTSIQGNADYQTPAKQALIAQVRQHMATIRQAQALPEAQAAQAEQQIGTAFGLMGPLLAQLVGGAEFATESHPLPMSYPKRRWSAYPAIHIGPLAAKRIPQADLAARNVAAIRAALSASEQAAWNQRGNAILTCRPSASTTLPTGTAIGIAAPYRVEPGKKLKLVPQNTQGGGLINAALRPFGYRARSEGMDGDHIVEMQLGGPNILPNLWPLQKGENRSSGSTIASMSFAQPDGTRIGMDALKTRVRGGTEVWFVVTGTL